MIHRTVPSSSSRIPAYPGSDVYADIGGPVPVPTPDGEIYFALYQDAFTSRRRLYLMKRKSCITDTWKQYVADNRFQQPHSAESVRVLYLDNKPQYLITDDDASYVDGELRKFNTKELISQWVIAPYTHNANPAENIMHRIMVIGWWS